MVAAILLFAGNLASYVHVIAVRHAHCAEHGELVHVSAASTEGVPDTGETRDNPDARGTFDASARMAAAADCAVTGAGLHQAPIDPLDGGEHDHCALCPSNRERAWSSTAAHAIAAPHTEQPRPPWRARALAITSSLYIIAPKNSPPA